MDVAALYLFLQHNVKDFYVYFVVSVNKKAEVIVKYWLCPISNE